MTLADRSEREVGRFHAFLQAWLGGRRRESDEAFERVEQALAYDFEVISPDGTHRGREAVIDDIRNSHAVHTGGNPPFKIDVENFRHRLTAGDYCLVTFEEHQRVDESWTARISTAVFRENDDAPEGVEWVHLQETWLPTMGPGD